MRRSVLICTLALALALPAAASAHGPRWIPVPTGSTQQFRGLDAVDHRTAWVGGLAGQVLRTTDGGRSWQDVSPPGSAGLQFRDVEAQDADVEVADAVDVRGAEMDVADGGTGGDRVLGADDGFDAVAHGGSDTDTGEAVRCFPQVASSRVVLM